MLSAKFQFIINEKFTSDNKKQNNSRNNIGSIFIQIILCRNLNRSLLHKYKKKRNHCHCPYIKLRKPCYNDRGKSATSRRTCRNRMRRTTYKNTSCKTCNSSGNSNGTYNPLTYVNPCVSCSILTLSYNRNLIAMFCTLHINKHEHR